MPVASTSLDGRQLATLRAGGWYGPELESLGFRLAAPRTASSTSAERAATPPARSGEPWQVVLDSPEVTYTVVSAMPAAAMPRTLSQFVTTERAQLSVAPRGRHDSPMRRSARGFSQMAHPKEASR